MKNLLLLFFNIIFLNNLKKIKFENLNSNSNNIFHSIPQVKIDEKDKFKYIQILCNESNYFIWGSKKYKYHNNIYQAFKKQLNLHYIPINLCKVLGGGRILFKKKKKNILVYGYSNRFGRCDHNITVNILKKYYNNFNISFSNKGY
jgi:phosphohistidine phosphatase